MNEQPFYCEYRVKYPPGSKYFFDSGSIKTKTLDEMRAQVEQETKRALERGALEIHFQGIAETYVKHHAGPLTIKLA